MYSWKQCILENYGKKRQKNSFQKPNNQPEWVYSSVLLRQSCISLSSPCSFAVLHDWVLSLTNPVQNQDSLCLHIAPARLCLNCLTMVCSSVVEYYFIISLLYIAYKLLNFLCACVFSCVYWAWWPWAEKVLCTEKFSDNCWTRK